MKTCVKKSGLVPIGDAVRSPADEPTTHGECGRGAEEVGHDHAVA
jgi:hypothetical protein